MRTVLITGAAGGIGAAAAEAFAAQEDRVLLNYRRSEQAARSLEERLLQKGQEAYCLQADVSDPQQVRRMFDIIEANWGGVDVLVNNAGIAQIKLFTDLTDEDWNRMIGVHLNGTFYCCRAALPYMIRQHEGRIINISSMWGQIGGSCEVHYSAAKAGVIGLTKALAKEEGLSGITVNCVAPGVIRTNMTAELTEEDIAVLRAETPTGSIGTPEDVARAILFLAGQDASFITGQILAVNGGFVT